MLQSIVIGSGIGGLAIAVRLARKGHSVRVFEASPRPGGKIAEFRHDGFRFDMGPSLFTLPHLLDELLDEDLRPVKQQLDVIARYFFADGTRLNAWSDPEKMAAEAELLTGTPRSAVMGYLHKAKQLYELTAPVFIFSPLPRWYHLFSPRYLIALLQLPRINAFSTLHQVNKKTFRDKRLVQLFDRYATYNGSNPYSTPGTMRLISHLEHTLGAFLPGSGMYSIAEALSLQARRLGVELIMDCRIDRVVVENFRVKGVFAANQFIPAHCVVSDVDIHQFYDRLYPDQKALKKVSEAERSSSALIFYWGVNRTFPQLHVHNVFFAADYQEEFHCLFKEKSIHADPTVYVYISSKLRANDAPPGAENWFVMVNAPENAGQDWEAMRPVVRQAVIRKLEQQLGELLEKHILFERVLDPASIESGTGSFRGSLYGASSNSRFAAFRRHPNKHPRIGGLYFTGGSVHPGGGIPLCLASAQIVDKLIDRYDKSISH